MHGADDKQSSMFSVVSPERRIPADHPLRRIKAMADEILAGMSSTFDAMYSRIGRPSIPPERLLKSQVLMALYTVRSDRQFCEQLDYNPLFRWFLDMSADEPTFDASSFSRNRDRLLEHEVADQFFAAVVAQARAAHLMSHDHFTVDGTLIEAWASLKSFKRKDGASKDREPPDDPGNPTVDFHGEKRSNETHESTTDREARLARKKGKESKLSYSAHAFMENRNGLIVDFRIDQANGFAERRTALDMLADNVVKGAARHGRRRQGLRHGRLRARLPADPRHAAHRADQRSSTTIRDRRPHDTPRWLPGEHAQTKARRGDLRLDEERRELPTDALQRHPTHAASRDLRRRCLQHAPRDTLDRGNHVAQQASGVRRRARRRQPRSANREAPTGESTANRLFSAPANAVIT
jgi:transposase